GLLIFAFSVAFWSTWDLIESKATPRRLWIWHVLTNGLLWLSHPLGAVYGSILAVLYAGFSLYRKTFSLGNALAFSGGPVAFLLWLPSFLTQSRIKPTFTRMLEFPEWDWIKMSFSYATLESPALGIVSIFGILLVIVLRWKRFGPANSESCSSTGSLGNSTQRTQPLYSGDLAALS